MCPSDRDHDPDPQAAFDDAAAIASYADRTRRLLTMHFVPHAERLPTLREIHRRLKQGASFVMAHMSFPQSPEERPLWLARYVAFAIASGVAPENAGRAARAIGASLPLVGPDDEEALIAQAGFSGTGVFYAGLAFRGWIARA